MDPEVLERLAARHAELDELEEHLVKEFGEAKAERDELAVAERVLPRMRERTAGERAAAAPASAQIGGRALLVPHRSDSVDETALPDDYRRILAIVRVAGGPVQVRAVGEERGLQVEVRGNLEPLRATMVKLSDRGWLHRRGDGKSTAGPVRIAPTCRSGHELCRTARRRRRPR
ncbi:hypothetical protein ACIRBZ_02625 [Streptomyces sp. NPDC094038]|uniref:hypothetical protein n=1 Tax=Streptomyces sp. NPDC094038 TaxID=3366055 RepID=UPI0037FE4528